MASDDPTDPTNTVVERLIGLAYEVRAKTMRGFKSPAKAIAHPYLAEYLRGWQGERDLTAVI